MVQLIRCHRFELVRSPVTKIERPDTARLEGITGKGNMVKMKNRRPLNDICHYGWLMEPKRS
jgi:hypothetical protein